MNEMKQGLVVLVIMISSLVIEVSAQSQSQNEDQKALAQRSADVAIAMSKVRSLPVDQTAGYVPRLESLKANSEGSPAMLFLSYGNSKTGISIQAYNAKELPDGTVITARKIVGKNVVYLGGTTFFGNMPAGLFAYPFEDGTRSTWTEGFSVNRYEIFTFFPDGSTSYSYLEKPVNKYSPGMFTPEKLILGGSAKFIRDQLVVELIGPITNLNSTNISVIVEDPEVDYDQWVPGYEVRTGKLLVSFSNYAYEIPEGGEFNILVGNSSGQTDQYRIRVPYRTRR